MNTNNLLNNTQLINTNRAVDNLTSSLQRNCEIESNKDYNNIKTILEEGCNNTTLNSSNPEAVNYLYLSYIRGGSNKKSMNNIKESFCNTCNKEMNGGCFTCVKGKKGINSHFRLIVINLPKLYKKYKIDKSVNNRKKKGGECKKTSVDTILDANSTYKIEDLLNFKYLNNFSNYKEYTPFNVSEQISLS